jgi:integrase
MTVQEGAEGLWREQDLILPSEVGTPIEQGRVHRHWGKAVAKAGIPLYRIHDQRHTVASHLIMQGFDALQVARILGHSNAGLVWSTCGHMAQTTKRKAADMFEALLQAASPSNEAAFLGVPVKFQSNEALDPARQAL